MSENKTKATDASVQRYLTAIDLKVLAKLVASAAREKRRQKAKSDT